MTIRFPSLAAMTMALLALAPTPRAAAVIALEATTQSNLAFGQIVATSSAGAVTVWPNGSRTASGGVVLGNAFGVSAASFAVTGEPNSSYGITLPSPCTLSAAGASMTADVFTSNPSGSGSLGPSGTQTVTMGATLRVGSRQVSAGYSGSYAVTLAYP